MMLDVRCSEWWLGWPVFVHRWSGLMHTGPSTVGECNREP